MNNRPDLPVRQLWNISMGFFGVQIAYALQSANISRIFATLGADPHTLSYFWILPPLMGILVQPIVGHLSDNHWTRLGRRKPYLLIGALIAVIIMVLLPNSGSFGLSVSSAMLFGVVMLIMLDTSINMAMQPFKMMVGDMVNDKQKSKAYSIQSLLCNAGSLMGYLFPFIFAMWGISNIADQGVVPNSVIYSFYIGALILIVCSLYTFIKVKETPPTEAELLALKQNKGGDGLIKLLRNAPKVFWTVGLVQLFSWVAFMYMWTYTNGAIADTVWGVTDVKSADYQTAGNWVGILFAVQAVGSILWAMVLPMFKSKKVAYSLSLILGGVGFISTLYIHDQYLLFASYLLIGCAWAAMLAMPFVLLTNALSKRNMGTYLGLFNSTICIPQILAAIIGGKLLSLLGGAQVNMLVFAGVALFLGAASVCFIKENK